MSITYQFDVELAKKNYFERKERNVGKQIDNSSLFAGSPMYYYCKQCGEHLCTLPESHIHCPPNVCDPCKILLDHGAI